MTTATGPMRATRPDLDPANPYGELAGAAGWAQERLARSTGPLPAITPDHPAAVHGRDMEQLRQTNPIPVLAEAQEALAQDEDHWATGATVLEAVADGLRHLDDAPATAQLRAAGGHHRKPGTPSKRATHGRHRNQAAALRDSPVIMLRSRALAAMGISGWCPDCTAGACAFHDAMDRRAADMFRAARQVAEAAKAAARNEQAAEEVAPDDSISGD